MYNTSFLDGMRVVYTTSESWRENPCMCVATISLLQAACMGVHGSACVH